MQCRAIDKENIVAKPIKSLARTTKGRESFAKHNQKSRGRGLLPARWGRVGLGTETYVVHITDKYPPAPTGPPSCGGLLFNVCRFVGSVGL